MTRGQFFFPQRDTFSEFYEFGEQIVDYLLFRFQTFDAAEITKEIIENISKRIPRFSWAKVWFQKADTVFTKKKKNICACYNDVFPAQAGLIAIERAVAFATVWFED